MPQPVTLAEALEHEAFVRRLAHAAVADDADAEDVAQDALAALARTSQPVQSVRGWLATVVRRRASTLRRASRRRRAHESQAARPDGAPDPADVVAREEVRRRLLEAVLGLPPDDRDALLMRYYDDVPPRVLAARLGVAVETARSRVHRALGRLRERLDARYGGRASWAVALARWAEPATAPTAPAPRTPLGSAVASGLALLGAAAVAWVGVPRLFDDREPETGPAATTTERGAADGPTLAAAPSAAPGPRARGRVSGVEGRVLSGAAGAAAEVVARRAPIRADDPLDAGAAATSPPAARADAAPDGRFTLRLPAAGAWVVEALAPDGRRAAATVEVPVDGALVAATLVLEDATGTLEGRVRRADGRPFDGTVTAHPADVDARRRFPATVVRCDAAGRFRLEGLRVGAVSVTASDGEVTVTTFAIRLPAAAPLDLVLPASDTALRVLVTEVGRDGGRTPRADADVVVETADEGAFARRVEHRRTGPDGLTTFGRGRGAVARVRVDAPGHGSRTVTARADAPDPFEVVLARTASVVGTVRDGSTGRPAPGVEVVAVPAAGAATHPPRATRSDADGRYLLDDLAAGSWTVVARDDDRVAAGADAADRDGYDPLAVELTPGLRARRDLTLVPAASQDGVVVDAAGQPVAGAVVAAQPVDPAPAAVFATTTTLAATAPDGTFRLAPMQPGVRWRLVARRPGATSAPHEVTATPGPLAPVRLVLGTAPRTPVVVLTSDGTPVEGARVLRAAGGAADPGDARVGVTGPDGRVDVDAGWPAISVSAAGYVEDSYTALEGPGATTTVRLLRGTTAEGRVVGPDGEPVPGASLFVLWDERSPSSASIVACDGDGRFRLEDVPDGAFHVTCDVTRGDEALTGQGRVVAGGEPVVLRLARRPAAAAAEGLVVTAVGPDGRRIARASVVADAGDTTVTLSLEDGRAALVGLPRGAPVTVTVSDARDADGVRLPLATGRCEVSAGVHAVTVELPAGRTLAGRVVGPDGAAIAGARVVAARPPTGGADPTEVESTRTDDGGAFRFTTLADEEHWVWAHGPRGLRSPVQRGARPGAAALEVPLVEGASCTVVVTDERGAALEGLRVRTVVRADDGADVGPARVARTTDASGRVRLEGLDPDGRYDLVVEDPARRWLAVERTGWRPADERFTLRPARTIEGRVVDELGAPVARAAVDWRPVGSGFGQTRAATDGTFRIGQLDAGDVELIAVGAGDEPGEPVRVAAGARDVVLVARLGDRVTLRVEGWPPTVMPRTARVHVDGPAGRRTRSRTVAPDGTIEVSVPRGGRRSLWVPPLPDGRFVWVEDLGDARDVTVGFSTGRPLRGRVEAPAGARDLEVLVTSDEGRDAYADVAPDGAFEVAGLPDGRYRVEARGRTDRDAMRAATVARPGDDVVLRLEPAGR